MRTRAGAGRTAIIAARSSGVASSSIMPPMRGSSDRLIRAVPCSPRAFHSACVTVRAAMGRMWASSSSRCSRSTVRSRSKVEATSSETAGRASAVHRAKAGPSRSTSCSTSWCWRSIRSTSSVDGAARSKSFGQSSSSSPVWCRWSPCRTSRAWAPTTPARRVSPAGTARTRRGMTLSSRRKVRWTTTMSWVSVNDSTGSAALVDEVAGPWARSGVVMARPCRALWRPDTHRRPTPTPTLGSGRARSVVGRVGRSCAWIGTPAAGEPGEDHRRPSEEPP